MDFGMKKILLVLFFAVLIAVDSSALSRSGNLVTPTENYTPPALSEKGAWTLVIVPDTQTYMKKKANHSICNTMFKWIADNLQTLDIQVVLHTGDLVELNENKRTYPPVIDCNSEQQWHCISEIFKHLDNKVPYVVSTGNHDYGSNNSENRRTNLSKYFTLKRSSKLAETLIEQGKNTFGEKTLENAAYEITVPNGRKLLIVTIQFAPTNEQINWAKEIFAREKYRNHFGILLTHSYLQPFGRIFTGEPLNGQNGRTIFKKMVATSDNIKLVICGHFATPDSWQGSTAFFKQKNSYGSTVYEMLFDPQAIGGGWHGTGGDGWIRLLEFSEDMKKVKVRTFSPYFASDKATEKFSYHTAPFNEFVFTYED